MPDADAFPDAPVEIRVARDADGEAIGWLTARCWADYPGCYYDRHGELGDLDRIATHYGDKGGRAFAATSGARLVGSIAVAPTVGREWELTKLYVDPRLRRIGLASRLLSEAEEFAVARGGQRMILWTDTRFEGAHRFYERQGYVADGRTRALHDLSNSIEYFYARALASAAGG